MNARMCLKSMRGRDSIPDRHGAHPKDVLDRNHSRGQIYAVRARQAALLRRLCMRVKSVLLAVGFLIALPLGAYAQASLSGLVRDASGAVLPGVTVEASSPVLIEKARSAVSDDAGRYTISDLRPGSYRVTFTLQGFKTVVREGVELAGTQVVSINAD